MMKKMRKMFSILLAMVMVLVMAATVFADTTTYKITAPADTTHTYEVYQIFTGDLSEGILSNVKWGINGTGTEAEAVAEDILTKLANVNNAGASDRDKLDVIEKYVDFSSTAYGTLGKDSGTLTGVPAGYYLIKDKDDSLKNQDEAYTLYIVKVAENITINPKADKPSVDKQVKDEAEDQDASASGDDGWGETADHAINESFQFKLTASLPASTNFAAYKKYTVKFDDTMSNGITFEKIESVKIGETTVPVKDGDNNGYVLSGVSAGDAGKTWTLTIEDIKKFDVDLTDGATVEVIYSAHLNENAKVNKETGETTNNNSVKLEYSNNPNTNGEGDLGETPEDYVWVFTYEVDNNKIDGETEEALAGAGFKLYDAEGTTEIGLIYDATLGAYRPVKGEEEAEEMFSAKSTGIFNIVGLDAGTYTLKETTTPSGYNTCPNKTVIIKASHAEAANGASATATLDKESTMSNTIENNKGTTLPSTGGIGTKIFYTIGAVLVLGAAILLVTKKRVSGQR